ncbi:MAG TPA: hypothetical protein IAA04_01190 [Candidatus Lachnoclostridium pullistercoris]|uniref:Uncharacterized protein n=1 Tax=Candidatus Lachnoclostridium pullistercoris TaxID=2838632 RepID=A0A9D2T4X7_9FIRM|nr:hypothetical protein [Candidatus Lachnoclostridium pullistercoris]
MKRRLKNISTKSPKKNSLLLCICAVYITLISGMLIGCANTQSDSADDNRTDLSSDAQTGTAETPPAQPSESEENTYKFILLGKSNFICTDLANESLNISEISKAVAADDSVAVSAAKFTILDIDGDGEDEAVLWLQINNISDYGFEILHYQNGETYGYTLQYRAFMNLKTDGTFSFSSGAADSGIGKMTFSETGYSINPQAYSQSGYDTNNEFYVQYFINNESCSEDEFNDIFNEQEQKADAEWHDLSENNINAILQ